MSDRILPQTAAEEADWEAVFSDQLPRVYNFFRYRLGDGPDAEDLTADTFERAWRFRGRYRRDLSGFSTWIFSIAQRLAIDHYRARRRHLPLEAASDIAGGATPEDLHEARANAERLERLLGTLPDRERELVALKFGAGLTNRAIARLSGLSESNVGTILHRTVEALRNRWDGAEGGSP